MTYASLTERETLQLLFDKLIEEAQEAVAARGQNATAEELADMFEVLRSIMH